MGVRKFIPELIGMALYVTDQGEYFYAWNADKAIKKCPNNQLFVVTDFGNKVHVRGTQRVKGEQ